MSNNIEWVRKPGMTRTPAVPASQEPEEKALEDMTIPQLRELAEARGVDVSEFRLKADILAALQAAEGEAETVEECGNKEGEDE